ncbi:uncharacterized protein LOC123853571 isoform X2 [Mirounga angustirostris]|uniref:uncharacterized protein LOC123853571 isoform X2 n=1 Tax=Mirounga angustirostris TaxID=9716 RepID=UPI00313BC40F
MGGKDRLKKEAGPPDRCSSKILRVSCSRGQLLSQENTGYQENWAQILICLFLIERHQARWRSRRPGFRLLSGIQLDRDQTILNTYKLKRRSKKRIATTL